ncbi:MAG: dTDP-glucose 4,6-dehydratase [Actinomycetota bacterium]|nr:dTDP-glucose 4,6-dehydratase [Actinomycetota bacterium]MDG2119726.1 dTDP-glucose 4,6-dehydratase [Actinomycetota bacterium]
MKILVTGGAGFIASNFVRRLLKVSDDEITILDCLTYAGDRRTLADLMENSRVSFVQGDVCDRETVNRAVKGHKQIVHFAAESHVDRSIQNPDQFVLTNCLGTNVMCDVARTHDIEKLVHVSTDETYGSIETGSFDELDLLNPSSPYAASKAASDLIALSYRTTFDLPVIVTRSSNNYGPFQHPEKLIPLFITNLLDGLSVPLYGTGQNIRDWIYVEDNCNAIETVLRSGNLGETYNIGADNEVTNLDITNRLIGLCEAKSDAMIFVEDRLGHDLRYSVDCSKVRSLGWTPRMSLPEGLAKTVDWYRENQAWWRGKKS